MAIFIFLGVAMLKNSASPAAFCFAIIFRVFIPLCPSFASALAGQGTEIYWVEPGGNDSNPCTETLPCQRVNHVLQNLAGQGDVLKLLPGVYREQIDIRLQDFTLEGVGEGVQLFGAQIPALIATGGMYVAPWSWGTSFQNTPFCSNLTGDVGVDDALCNTLGFWQDEHRLVQVLSKTDVVAGTFYYDFEQEEVWLLPVDGGGAENIEGLAHPYVVRLTEESRNVTLRNLEIMYGASMPDDGILQIEGQGHTIEKVDVRFSAGAGILIYGADEVIFDNVNAIHHGQNGWRIRADASFNTSTGWTINDWVDGLQVLESSSLQNGWKGYDNCWGGGGTKFSFTRNLLIDRFYSADNAGFGLWLDIENQDYEISASMSARDAGRGIFVEYISDNGLVENNVVFGTRDADDIGCGVSVGLAAADSRNVVLKNNTVYSTEPDVKGMMLKTGCSSCRSFPYSSENITWENNLLVNKEDAGFVRDLDAGTNDSFTYLSTAIEEEFAGDGSILICWDSFGGCTEDLLGIEILTRGDYLEDATSECGFDAANEAIAGIGALNFEHPRATEICPQTTDMQPPEAAFTHTVDGLSIVLTDLSTDDGAILEWLWDFGDGNTATLQHPVHAYLAAGTYSVRLTVTDDQGLTDATEKTITVVLEDDPGEPPLADFTYAISDHTVTFTDLSSDDESIASWNWQFGDGATAVDQNPVHTYDVAGLYDVSLAVTDNDGMEAEIQQELEIVEAPPPPRPLPRFHLLHPFLTR